MRFNRIQEVERYISRRGTVTIADLIREFQVSTNTIRRDLKELQKQGKIDIIYGGATVRQNNGTQNVSDPLSSYAERNVLHAREKERVARAAAALIHDNDVIFIDTGTSTVPLIHYLSPDKHLTILTNSVYILYSCIDRPQLTVIGLPGTLKNKTASLVGSETERALEHYNSIDKVFMACSSYSLEGGACNSSPEESVIKRIVMKKSSTRCLLLDNSKMGRSSLLSFAAPDAFQYIITDRQPEDRYLEYLKQCRTTLLIAD